MQAHNRWSRRPVTGDGPADVSLTSHGHRISSVYLTLESMARGTVRPRRLILWLNDPALVDHPPRELVRLRRRGLEVRLAPNHGPHTKYYPYVESAGSFDRPLVVADDDILYPRTWLQRLTEGHARHPDDVVGYRAHQIVTGSNGLEAYSNWKPRSGTHAGFDVFCTGVSGMVLPLQLLAQLKNLGEAFSTRCPRADDVWIHEVSVRSGIRHRQLESTQRHFRAIPGSQLNTLHRLNVVNGGNDAQIRATYSSDDVSRIADDANRPTLEADQSVSVPHA